MLGSDRGKGKCMVRPLGEIRVGVVYRPQELANPNGNRKPNP